jgi:alpha-ketoglutarate-dependent taurine dioxygenase
VQHVCVAGDKTRQERTIMADNTLFTAFHLDITGPYVEERIAQALSQNGLIIFDGIQSRGELLQLCSRLGTIVKHRDADEAGLTRIAQRSDLQSGEGYQAFTSSHLTLHTDGSSIPEPPTLVVLWCEQPAAEGGASLFVDGKQLYQILANDHPQVLETLSTPNSALFAGAEPPVYGSIFSTGADDSICVRFRYDGLGYYAAPVCSVLPIFLELLERHTLAIPLQKQQGYILQNGRWLHGRTAFRGEREMYRILVRTDHATSPVSSVRLGFQPD